MQARGANSQILIQEETNYGADPTTIAAKKVVFLSESIKNSIALLEDPSLQARRDSVEPIQDKVSVTGGLDVNLQSNDISSLFKGLLGGVTTTDTAGSAPYTHTIKSANTIPSFVIEKGFTDIGQYFKYNGMKVNSFSLNATPTGYQKCTFNFIGQKETISATPYDSAAVSNYNPFDGINNLISVKEGGVVLGIGTDLTLDVNNNLDAGNYTFGNNGEIATLPEGLITATGTLTVFFEDVTLYNKAINNTTTSIDILYQKGTGDGSSGNESLEIILPEIKFETETPVISGAGGVTVALPFRAFYQASIENSSVEIIIKNMEATI